MASKTLDSQIFQSLSLLQENEKQFILLVIKSFLKRKGVPTERLSIEQYNKEIDEAVKRIENGEFYSMEEVEEMAKYW